MRDRGKIVGCRLNDLDRRGDLLVVIGIGVECKRLNFDRLDGGGIKRCVKPETVRRAIWPG